MQAPQLQFTLYSKAFGLIGNVSSPMEAHVTIAANAAGTASLTVDNNDPRIAALATPGCRCVVSYRQRNSYTWTPIFSGPVDEDSGHGNAGDGTTFTVSDDWAEIFNGLIGYPKPANSIDNQGAEGVFYTQTGAAETVLKNVVTAMAARQGVPITVPATTGLGSSVTVSFRFDTLVDKLFPAVDKAGVLARVIQVGNARTLLCSAPGTVQTITEGSKVVADYEYSRKRPELTRCIVATGSATDATQRAFREYVLLEDGVTVKRVTDLAAGDVTLESALNVSKTTLVEVSGDSGTLDQLMLQTAKDTLATGSQQVSLAMTLQETPQWEYGVNYMVGDRVPVQLAGQPVITDYIRTVDFDFDREGLIVTPTVGDWASTEDAPSNALTEAVAALSKVVRTRQRNFK